jgi:hypothetical protein
MKKKIFGYIILTVVVLVFFSLFLGHSDINKEDGVYYNAFKEKYHISAVKIPEKIDFAGELVPLYNFDTRESLERELLVNVYWQSQTLLLLKRSKRYMPVIESILKNYGIPDDFKYLPVIESAFTNQVSSSGAAGFWQFLEPTAKELGLEINKEIDERYNLEKSTEAACKFFLKSYDIYKSWTMAAASYNCGRKALNDQILRQKTEYFYDLLLNEETSRYIFRILAIKTIFENPAEYGFYLRDSDYYKSYELKKVKVDTAVSNFANFAQKFNINYKILKFFNPWLRDTLLSNKTRKTYYINIPVNLDRKFSTSPESFYLDTANISNY